MKVPGARKRDLDAPPPRHGPRGPPHLARRQGGQGPHRAHRSPARPILEDYLTSLRPALAKSAFLLRQPLGASRPAIRGTLRPDDRGQAGPARLHRGRGHWAPLPPRLAALLRHQPAAPGSRRPRRPAPSGHSTIATTTRYLHLSDADLTDAVDKAFPAERATPPAASLARRRGGVRGPPGRIGPPCLAAGRSPRRH